MTDSQMYRDAKFKIGDDEWTVKYRPFVTKDGHWVKAGRYPEKKEIYLSIYNDRHKPYSKEELIQTFQKAVMPYILDYVKTKYPEKDVESAKEIIENVMK